MTVALRVMIGFVWLALALAKALAIEPAVDFVIIVSGSSVGAATAAVYSLILAEAMLGVGVLAPVHRVQRGCILATVILTGLLALATLMLPLPAPCGCFGILGRASDGRKLVVTCGMMFLAVEYLHRSMGSSTDEA